MESLYHYTSVQGFYSIFKESAIRVTRSDFMNDSKEGAVFCKIIEDFVKHNGNNHLEDKSNENLNKLIERFNLVEYLKQIENHLNYYIFSLTVESDNLPMWNYYGSNGIQLEFSYEKIIMQIKSNNVFNKKVIYGKVLYVDENIDLKEINDFDFEIYDKEKIKNYLECSKNRKYNGKQWPNKICSFIYNCIVDLQYSLEHALINNKISLEMNNAEIFEAIYNNSMNTNNEMIFKKELLYNLLALSSLVKVDSYKNENEYRIVLLNSEVNSNEGEIHFLSKYNNIDFIKPGININLTDIGMVKSVYLSPVMKNLPINGEKYLYIIKDFLKSNGLTDTKIDYSCHDIRW